MTTQLYDHEFAPWRIDGDRRIVAPEIRLVAKEPTDGPSRVRVIPDVFEPWDGPLLSFNGRVIPDLTMAQVRSRMFELFDRLSHLTWLLETSHPENVAAMWPSADIFEGQTGDDKPAFWPSLWLYARVDTQSDADARIPRLLDAPAAVRGLVMTPREDVDLTRLYGGITIGGSVDLCVDSLRGMAAPAWRGRKTVPCSVYGSPVGRINHVIIRGGVEPMHPDHVRSLVRQCDAAGVPVWCEAPVDGREWNQLPEGRS